MDRQRRRRGAPGAEPRDRSAALLRFPDALEARFADLVDLNVLEVGSVRSWAEFLQVGLPMQHLRDMAERVMLQYEFEKPMAPTVGGGTFGSSLAQGVVRREPLFVDVDNSMTIAQKRAGGVPARQERHLERPLRWTLARSATGRHD